MSGDVIETMAKALAQTLANESGHAHPFAGGYSHHKRKVTPEHERKARALTLAVLSVVRDELNGASVRATCAMDDDCERCQGADGTFANVMALFGGAP